MNRSIDAEIKRFLLNQTDKDLIPYYKTVYTASSVELENAELLLSIDKINEQTCLTILSNSCKELKADYNNYLMNSYQTLEYTEERLSYIDVANISRFIIWKFKKNETQCFDNIFNNAEIILKRGNKEIQELIVIGFFESMQNISGWHKVDYHYAFDKWLRPQSKKEWDALIEFWEKKRG
jgi:hypothetical protein